MRTVWMKIDLERNITRNKRLLRLTFIHRITANHEPQQEKPMHTMQVSLMAWIIFSYKNDQVYASCSGNKPRRTVLTKET